MDKNTSLVRDWRFEMLRIIREGDARFRGHDTHIQKKAESKKSLLRWKQTLKFRIWIRTE